MLKLLLFAPCEKVIVSKEENTSTLITILETVNIPATPDQEGMVPFRWFSYALWHADAQEDHGSYEARLRLIAPDKGEKFSLTMPFAIERPFYNHRLAVGFPAFPLMSPGTAHLVIELRRPTTDVPEPEWREVDRFPMVINRPEVPQQEEPTQAEALNEAP